MKIHMRMGDDQSSTIALALVVLGMVAFWYFTVYERPITNHPTPYPTQNTSIVAFGGSITAGAGALQSGGFVSLLEQELDTSIIQAGILGNTAGQAWSRISQVTRHKPRIVILELGTDDSYIPKTPYDDFYSRMERIIDTLHQSGAAVIIVETPGFNRAYRNLAHEHNTALVPGAMQDILGDDHYMFNEKYPSDAGHAHIAQKIKPVLQKLIQQ